MLTSDDITGKSTIQCNGWMGETTVYEITTDVTLSSRIDCSSTEYHSIDASLEDEISGTFDESLFVTQCLFFSAFIALMVAMCQPNILCFNLPRIAHCKKRLKGKNQEKE